MLSQNMLPLIADRFLNTPLLLDPTKAQTIFGVLRSRITADVPLDLGEFRGAEGAPEPEANRFRGVHRTGGGDYTELRREGSIAMIDVIGSLVNRGRWVGASSGLTSYEGIGAMADKARVDGDISAAILDINSPGGEATGMFGVAEKVRALAAVKPVIAVVNDMAASAAYGIASAATEIVISPTSFVGSIGVVMVHIDQSGELEQAGLKATIIQAGAHKTDGHSFGPLSDDVRANLQAKTNTIYDRFLETVEAGRGERLTAADARATEAAVFIGQEAIDLGLADRVGTFDAVLDQLRSTAPSGITTENVMTTNTNGPKTEGSNITQAQLDQAVADAKAAGITEGKAQATTRIGAILSSDAGKANPKLAAHFAFKTELDAEAANAALAEAGPGAAAKQEPQGPGERAEGAAEFGADDDAGKPGDAPAANPWGAVVTDINKRVG